MPLGAAVAAVALSAWAMKRWRRSNEGRHAENSLLADIGETALYNVPRAEVAHALSKLRACSAPQAKRPIKEGNEWAGASFEEALHFVEQAFASAGFQTRRDAYVTQKAGRGIVNITGEKPGRRFGHEVVIVGAQLSCGGHEGTDVAGAAALLALARSLALHTPDRTLRLVAFAHEGMELRGRGLGSHAYAQACKQLGENVHAMLSLELLGASARGPLVFAGARSARTVAEAAAAAFSLSGHLVARVATVPSFVPWVRASEHIAFARQGYAAFMATDQGPLLYPHARSRPASLRDHAERVAQISEGLLSTVKLLAGGHDA